jgi:ABC-type polysaccharide transport system permease subunit
MLTLLLAYGAYRGSKKSVRLLQGAGASSSKGDATQNSLVVAYGVLIFLFWPLIIPALLLEYLPKANPVYALLSPAPMLLSLLILGPIFYFCYSILFLIIGIVLAVIALDNAQFEEEQE